MRSMKMMVVSSILGGLLLTACASQNASDAAGQAVQQTRAGMADAALTPLEDLNLRREAIPRVLAGLENPYDVPDDITCGEIKQQLTSLEEVLGPDWDMPSDDEENNVSLAERAAEESSEKILDIIADEAASLIPYRSWIRRLSGAKDHEKKVKEALERGKHRRTYLKAIARSRKCDSTVAPRDESKNVLPSIKFSETEPPQYREKPANPDTTAGEVQEAPLAELDSRLSFSEKTSSQPTWK